MLGVTQPRVSQLARRGFLPFERTPDGRRVFRPTQVEVIANAPPRAVPLRRLTLLAPWNATGPCTVLEHERPVRVLHGSEWVDGSLTGQRRDPDGWWGSSATAPASASCTVTGGQLVSCVEAATRTACKQAPDDREVHLPNASHSPTHRGRRTRPVP